MSRQTDFAEIKRLKDHVRSWRRTSLNLQEENAQLKGENKKLQIELEKWENMTPAELGEMIAGM